MKEIKDQKKMQGESPEEYIWRIGQMKDNGSIDATWYDLGKQFNEQLRPGQMPWTESAYRKKYQQSKKFLGEVFEPQQVKPSDYADEIDKKKQDLEKERIKQRDERAAYRRQIREEARVENNVEQILNEIRSIGQNSVTYKEDVRLRSGSTEQIVQLSDVHYGIEYYNGIGAYSPEIARERVMQYASEIKRIADRHESACCHVVQLGDMISGTIHRKIALENRENLIKQVIGCAEQTADFLMEQQPHFEQIEMRSVSGNHSRVEPNFNDALNAERLDELIPWYVSAKLNHVPNVRVYSAETQFDATADVMYVKDLPYAYVHGDYDYNSEQGQARLTQFQRVKPYAILGAHQHVADMSMGDIVSVRNGSVCGSGDEFTIRHRQTSMPYQVCLVVDDEGIVCNYPVVLY